MPMLIVNEGRKEDVLQIQAMIEQGELLDFVSSGSTADVFRYKDLAIKVFKADKFDSETLSRLSLREVETMFRLEDSVYTPRVWALSEGDWVIMDYIEGTLLSETMNPPVLQKVGQVIEQFEFECAQAGICPMDISPDNVIIKSDGSPVFIDFGYYSVDGIPDEDEIGEEWENWENGVLLFNS